MTRTAAATAPMRRPLILAGVAASGSAGLAAVTSGGAAAASASLAVLVVVGFFGATVLAARAASKVPPQVELALLLSTYALKIGVLVVVLGLLEGVGWVDRTWLGGAAITCTLAWVVGQVVAHARARTPVGVPVGARS